MLIHVILTAALMQQPAPAASAEALFDAARRGDRTRVVQLLDAGVDVNARARYDATALGFAADKGHLDVVRLLVERGADVNVVDTFYKTRPIDWALSNDHLDVALYLLEKGSQGAGRALSTGIRQKHVGLVRAAVARPELDAETLATALVQAQKEADPAIIEVVSAAAAAKPMAKKPTVTVPAAVLQSYAGTYRNESSGFSVVIAATENGLTGTAQGQPPLTLRPTSETSFAAVEAPRLSVSFAGRGGMIESMTVMEGDRPTVLQRVVAPTAAPTAAPTTAPTASTIAPTADKIAPTTKEIAPRTKGLPWPAFRGANASGVADGQGAVAEFDIATGRNVRWKTPIPGIAVSSPIVWGDRVFVTTAVGSNADKTFRTGLYGDVKPVEDVSTHTWKVYALDRRSGAVVWERDAFTGTPKVKRHPKSSLASSTPATDGKHVVAVFGSIGLLVCYDVNGKKLWQRDIGVIDSGWFFDPTYQWGHSSSPVIHDTHVIVQADQQKGSYIAAFDLATGKPAWRTERSEEIPTWGTPTVVSGQRGDELVTNGTKIRGYDPRTGKLLWTLGPNSEVTVGTPVAGKDVIYVTGGYPPVRPVYAVKPGGTGDISLPKGQTASTTIAWSNDREGTYIPTPLLYRDILYTLNNNGVLTAYNAGSGERLYRARVGGGGAFSASPVAADGRLYFANEDGDVYVAKAGTEYVELGKYSLNEVIMATPAISDGVMVVRTLGHVYGIGSPVTTPAGTSERPREPR
jgi:outer membrane protein assembly factor BamB